MELPRCLGRYRCADHPVSSQSQVPERLSHGKAKAALAVPGQLPARISRPRGRDSRRSIAGCNKVRLHAYISPVLQRSQSDPVAAEASALPRLVWSQPTTDPAVCRTGGRSGNSQRVLALTRSNAVAWSFKKLFQMPPMSPGIWAVVLPSDDPAARHGRSGTHYPPEWNYVRSGFLVRCCGGADL